LDRPRRSPSASAGRDRCTGFGGSRVRGRYRGGLRTRTIGLGAAPRTRYPREPTRAENHRHVRNPTDPAQGRLVCPRPDSGLCAPGRSDARDALSPCRRWAGSTARSTGGTRAATSPREGADQLVACTVPENTRVRPETVRPPAKPRAFLDRCSDHRSLESYAESRFFGHSWGRNGSASCLGHVLGHGVRQRP
jgi:hypothetical protein